MEINKIRSKYNNGDYTLSKDYAKEMFSRVPLNHVFDENLSVKRNRELVIEHNQRVSQLQKERQEKQAELSRQLSEDVVNYIIENYSLTKTQAQKVESYVYQEKHAFMCDYFAYIDTFADFAEDLVHLEDD